MSQLMKNSSTCLMLLVLAPATFADNATSQDPETAAAKPLSVAPLDYVEHPQDRPVWVSQPANFDQDTHFIVVVSGPSDTPEESIAELQLMQRAAVSTYVSQFTDSGGQHDFYRITDRDIDNELVTRRYSGELKQGDMTKYEHAVELAFTEQKRQQIAAAWKAVEVRDRLGALGVIVFGGLAVLLCSSALVGTISRRVERREQTEAARSS